MQAKTIPIIAFLLAVAISITMDFTGYTFLSAYPLLAITLIFWFIQRQTKKEMGLVFGRLKFYILALLYPLIVLSATALIAYLAGDLSIGEFDESAVTLNLIVGVTLGPLVVLLTEEGFFRGWLWGAFRKAGFSAEKALWVTSILFVIWHISAVTAESSYKLPFSQIPIYLINGLFIGLIWGTLRWASGSIIVASVCHAVWNTLAYMLFGFGENVGLLGVTNTALFGPEVGYLGILLNGLFFLWLWRITKNSRLRSS
ncbi:MAG: CPBP family intramembrane glutamic endopeptidase [Bacteroidota bacterium]